MYITTSTEKRIRYSVTMHTIQYGLVNSAMGQIPCSTERISCCYYFYLPHSYSIQHGTDNKIVLRLSVCVCPSVDTLTSHFFVEIGHRRVNPQK